MYKGLPHHNSITYWSGYMDTPANWSQVYIALLHQNSITYWQMQIYQEQMDPPNDAMCT